jgi:outer membrane protein assembly factor BamA
MLRALLPLLAACFALAPHSVEAQDNGAAAPVVKVYGITLSGHHITKDRILLRELVIEEGDSMPSAVLYERMERSRQNLMNTGLFNTVTVSPLYLDQRSVMVEVTVNERWYLWPSIIFALADPNFNTWWLTKDFDRADYGLYLYKFNLRGRNETAYIKAQFGYTKQFAFHYKVPNLDARQRWGISMGGSFEEQAEITAGTVNNVRLLIHSMDGSSRDRWRADVEATLRRTHDTRHSWRLTFTQAQVSDTVTHVAVDYFHGPSTHTRYLTLGYSFVRDRRDSRAFTRAGQFQELKVDRYGLGLLDRAAPNITTLFVTTKHWFALLPKWTLGLSGRGKYTLGTPPYHAQEGLGYGNFVRGYEYYVIDGQHFALGKANLVFQLLKPRTYRMEGVPVEAFRTLYLALYLNVYSDLGYVWDSRYAAANFLDNRWINGNGIGLDLVTSYDQVLRGEYSINAMGKHGFFLHFTQPF